ncbi:MAG: hypothetical protein A2Y45_08720 [Tenericutes bacterium GWC2_34_14]|nr:MAG: hypothetical protein A2Z84_07635 [Tenericutes bacterium GWA2_35_7]OHE29975.1 MAG: hypothetical protein A2Y45_08720 [Tenericutes bacterium GWC2_34_14]OHE34954.1 MAG: hypothetical protein A2012_02330 [Tenericutes bacterium GWE2_34_108]OHE37186.1 MAG: hypothetical protein A2Y46_00680 [Tenericutes bacterium GWF1_35_14]OHE39682.1 MAG: hypothetical protein A2Y44_02180 [Tenericutes bacterium GWF2_35_184]OHE44130.1 MAG: hypothetical protein A2221_03330 [Tenericutes bacterium RIFOXYA2_FULL_36_3
MKISFKKTLIYIIGLIVISLGANILLRSRLGAGAWDTVSSNLSQWLHITLGTATAIVYSVVLGFVVLSRKNYGYLFIIGPILVLSFFFDFWDLIIFKDLFIELFYLRAILYVVGGYLLSLGLALTILSLYPAMVFEELTYTMMNLLKVKKFFSMRIMIEVFAILLATGFGFLAGIGFGAVNMGSFLLALILGPMISMNLYLFRKLYYFKSMS